MSKTEMVKRFKNAREVEQEAQQHAQMLADRTAAELESLARTMTEITSRMADALDRTTQHARTTSDSATQAGKTLTATVEALTRTVSAWDQAATKMQLQLSGQSRRWLAAVALSAVLGSVSATLLHHYVLDSPSQPSAITVTTDTDQLARQIVERWRQYQQGSNGNPTR